jgi:hypothetical protein
MGLRLLKRGVFLLLKDFLGSPQFQATWHMHEWKQLRQQTHSKTKQNVGRAIRRLACSPALAHAA